MIGSGNHVPEEVKYTEDNIFQVEKHIVIDFAYSENKGLSGGSAYSEMKIARKPFDFSLV